MSNTYTDPIDMETFPHGYVGRDDIIPHGQYNDNIVTVTCPWTGDKIDLPEDFYMMVCNAKEMKKRAAFGEIPFNEVPQGLLHVEFDGVYVSPDGNFFKNRIAWSHFCED